MCPPSPFPQRFLQLLRPWHPEYLANLCTIIVTFVQPWNQTSNQAINHPSNPLAVSQSIDAEELRARPRTHTHTPHTLTHTETHPVRCHRLSSVQTKQTWLFRWNCDRSCIFGMILGPLRRCFQMLKMRLYPNNNARYTSIAHMSTCARVRTRACVRLHVRMCACAFLRVFACAAHTKTAPVKQAHTGMERRCRVACEIHPPHVALLVALQVRVNT